MSIFTPASAAQINLSLLLLRVATGLTLAAHGWQKVFTYGLSNVANNFGQMGVPLAPVAGPFVAILELVGGIAVAAGLLTRPLALMLAIDMLVAALLVHLPNGFFAPTGMELTLLLAAGSLAVAIAGAGEHSVDAAIRNRQR